MITKTTSASPGNPAGSGSHDSLANDATQHCRHTRDHYPTSRSDAHTLVPNHSNRNTASSNHSQTLSNYRPNPKTVPSLVSSTGRASNCSPNAILPNEPCSHLACSPFANHTANTTQDTHNSQSGNTTLSSTITHTHICTASQCACRSVVHNCHWPTVPKLVLRCPHRTTRHLH